MTFWNGLAGLIVAITTCLSIWIVIPAPTLKLLPLGVAIPELSPWLIVSSTIGLMLSLTQPKVPKPWPYLLISLGVLTLLLSSLPLLQVNSLVHQTNQATEATFGPNYLAPVSSEQRARMRPQPISLVDVFRGISTDPSRYLPDIQFAAPMGQPLKMDIYQPPHKGIYPTVVVIYGGGWQSGSPKQHQQFNRYLANRGYTVFAIDYRHAPQYLFPAQLEDIQTALTFIRTRAAQYEADPNRIIMLGRSAGAHLALLTAYQTGTLPVQGVISYYGPTNLLEGYNDLPKPDPLNIRKVLETFLGGPPSTHELAYQAASPSTFVRPNLPPTLLIYGQRDHLVMSRFGKQLFNQLQQVRVPAVFLEIPWSEHAFDAIFQGLGNQIALFYTERFIAWAVSQ